MVKFWRRRSITRLEALRQIERAAVIKGSRVDEPRHSVSERSGTATRPKLRVHVSVLFNECDRW